MKEGGGLDSEVELEGEGRLMMAVLPIPLLPMTSVTWEEGTVGSTSCITPAADEGDDDDVRREE